MYSKTYISALYIIQLKPYIYARYKNSAVMLSVREEAVVIYGTVHKVRPART